MIKAFRRHIDRQGATISQILFSITSAAQTIVGATILPAGPFATFSILLLLQFTTVGFVRAVVLFPTLVESRYSENRGLPGLALSLAFAASFAFQFSFSVLLLSNTRDALAISVSTIGLLAYDAIRHVAIIRRNLLILVVSDTLRLPAALLALVAIDAEHPVAAVTQTMMFSLLPGLALLWSCWDLTRLTTLPKQWRAQSISQGGEFVIAQALMVIPLLIVALATQDLRIGSFRLAQSLIGPINLLFSAITVKQLTTTAQGVSDSAAETTRAFAQARYYSIRLSLITAGLTVAVALSSPVLSLTNEAIDTVAVQQSVISCGIYSLGGAIAGPYIGALRALRRGNLVLLGRTLMVIVTAAAYLVSTITYGPYVGLLMGAAVAGLMYPVSFNLIGFVYFRSRSRTDRQRLE